MMGEIGVVMEVGGVVMEGRGCGDGGGRGCGDGG